MWLLPTLPLFLVGAACLLLGLRGRRIQHAPACKRCGYALAGLNTLLVCPECGAGLLDGRGIATVRRVPIMRLMLIGVVLLGGSLAILGSALYMQVVGIRTVNLLPWWSLIAHASDRDGAPEAREELFTRIARAQASPEQLDALTQRVITGPLDEYSECVPALAHAPNLSPQTAERLAAWILQRQSDRTQPWSEWMGDAFEHILARGLLSDRAAAGYLAKMCAPVATVQHAGPHYFHVPVPVIADPRIRAGRKTAQYIDMTLTDAELCDVSMPIHVCGPQIPPADGSRFLPVGFVSPIGSQPRVTVSCSLRKPVDPASDYAALYRIGSQHRWRAETTAAASERPQPPTVLDRVKDHIAMQISVPGSAEVSERLLRGEKVDLMVAISCPDTPSNDADASVQAPRVQYTTGVFQDHRSKEQWEYGRNTASLCMVAGLRQGALDWWFDEFWVHIPAFGAVTLSDWESMLGNASRNSADPKPVTARPEGWNPNGPSVLILRIVKVAGLGDGYADKLGGKPKETLEILYKIDLTEQPSGNR